MYLHVQFLGLTLHTYSPLSSGFLSGVNLYLLPSLLGLFRDESQVSSRRATSRDFGSRLSKVLFQGSQRLLVPHPEVDLRRSPRTTGTKDPRRSRTPSAAFDHSSRPSSTSTRKLRTSECAHRSAPGSVSTPPRSWVSQRSTSSLGPSRFHVPSFPRPYLGPGVPPTSEERDKSLTNNQ